MLSNWNSGEIIMQIGGGPKKITSQSQEAQFSSNIDELIQNYLYGSNMLNDEGN